MHTYLLLMSCSARKRTDAGDLPAIQRYDGSTFRVLKKALRERDGLAEVLGIRILSAEYGLITDSTPILCYDRKMTRARALEVYLHVQFVINELRPLPAHIYIDLGATYRLAMPPLSAAEQQRTQWAMGGTGERLSQLKTWLWSIPL